MTVAVCATGFTSTLATPGSREMADSTTAFLEVARIGGVVTVVVSAGCPTGKWSMPAGSGCVL